MTNEPTITIVDFEPVCPKCGKAHRFKLKAIAQPGAEAKVSLFGGPGASETPEPKTEFLFTCPETNKKFSIAVSDAPGRKLVGIASEADIASAARVSPAGVAIQGEFAEWTKKSRDTALDFCKIMLSASTGGIPVYFVILKYIGFEKIGLGAISKLAVLPPMLFLVAAILYVLALRPRYEAVAPSDFNAFRQRRLEQLNTLIIGGTAVFVAAIALAIGVFFYTLSK